MNNPPQVSQANSKWQKLIDWCLKTLSDLAKNTIARTLSAILLGLPFLKEIVERVSGLSIKELMLYQLTTRIIPINPSSVLVSIVALVLSLIIGYRIKEIRIKNKLKKLPKIDIERRKLLIDQTRKLLDQCDDFNIIRSSSLWGFIESNLTSSERIAITPNPIRDKVEEINDYLDNLTESPLREKNPLTKNQKKKQIISMMLTRIENNLHIEKNRIESIR